jgi:hypothetical protein
MTSSNHSEPDQSWEAADAINADLFASDGVIPHATARLIAAAIHPGPGSALEHFAATGQFDVGILLREVSQLAVPRTHTPWQAALLGYLRDVQARHPWTRPVVIPRDSKQRPRPTRPDCDPDDAPPR